MAMAFDRWMAVCASTYLNLLPRHIESHRFSIHIFQIFHFWCVLRICWIQLFASGYISKIIEIITCCISTFSYYKRFNLSEDTYIRFSCITKGFCPLRVHEWVLAFAPGCSRKLRRARRKSERRGCLLDDKRLSLEEHHQMKIMVLDYFYSPLFIIIINVLYLLWL